MEEKDSCYHVPVMLRESLEGLDIRPDGIYVDVTFGGGGHSCEILKRLGSEGELYGFDQDADAEALFAQLFVPAADAAGKVGAVARLVAEKSRRL